MALPQFKTYEQVLADLEAVAFASGSPLTDRRDIAVVGRVLRAIAAVVAGAWVVLQAVFRSIHPVLTEDEEAFDLYMAVFGFFRAAGNLSSGSAYVENAGLGDVAVPAGLVLQHTPTGNRYTCTQSFTVPGLGYTFVFIRAQQVGALKDLPANAVLTPVGESLPGLTIKVGSSLLSPGVTQGDLTGGTERESLAAAKLRVPTFMRSLRGSVYGAVRQALLGTQGVTNLALLNTTPGAGYMTALIEPDAGSLISEELYTRVQNAFNGSGSGGIALIVEPIQKNLVNVSIDAIIADTTVAPATAVAAIQAAVAALRVSPTPGLSLYRSQIINAGMAAVSLTNLDLIEPATDIIASSGELVGIGSVVVNVRYQ